MGQPRAGDGTEELEASGLDISEAEALGAAAVLEQIAEGVIVTDQSGRIVLVNAAAARLHGVKRLDVEPDDYAEAYHLLTLDGEPYPPGDLPLARAVRHGQTVTDARWRIRRPDGSEVLAIGTARPLLDSHGVQKGAILTLRDDTARYQAEQDLAESEARFRSMADSAPSAVWVTNQNGIEFANRAFEEFAGMPTAQLSGEAWTGIVHPDDLPGIRAKRAAAWAAKEAYEFEGRFRGAGGDWLWLRANSRPRFDSAGALLGYVGMAVDITEARRAEAELKESEARLRLVQVAGGIGSFDYDLQKDEAICSPEYYALLGLPDGHPINRESWNAAIHPEDRGKALEALDRAIAGREAFDYEYRIVRADTGEVRWLAGRAAVVFDAEGRPWRYVGGNIDITDRKRAEHRLRESEERYRQIVEGAEDFAIVTMDEKGLITGWNSGAERLLGYREEEVVGQPGDVFFTPEDRAAGVPDHEMNQASANGRAVNERWHMRKDGSRFWGSGLMMPLDGTGVGYLKMFRDRTAEHEAETASRDRAEELQAVLDAVPAAIWIARDPESRTITGNRTSYDLLRVDPGKNASLSAPDAERPSGFAIYHDGRELAPEEMPVQRAAKGAVVENFQEEVRFDDGRSTFLLGNATPLRDADGKVRGAVAAFVDITDQHRYQQHLKLMVDELNHRVKNTLSIVQSLAQQTFRGEGVSQQARTAFEGRLSALAVAHNLLTRENWDSADLSDVVGDALHACAAGRFTADGPSVRLEPKTVVTVAMALHELCTNATKHGALSVEQGHVAVTWTVTGGAEPRLSIRWVESGGPPVTEPARRGFGTRMIERALASDLRGSARLDFRPEGVVCEIDARLPGAGA